MLRSAAVSYYLPRRVHEKRQLYDDELPGVLREVVDAPTSYGSSSCRDSNVFRQWLGSYAGV